jgi:lipopolysaccharide export LptBFGC system permease protein LptF
MRRIDRYFLAETLTPAAVGIVMLLLLLIGNVLYGLLYMLYEGAPVRDLGRVLLLSMPTVLLQAVPGSLLLGTSLALNRLEREREILALRMAGTRLLRLVAPFLGLGVVISLGMFALQERVIPQTTREVSRLIFRLQMGSPTTVVPRDVVFKVGQNFLYVRDIDPKAGTLHKVVVCKLESNGGLTWLSIPLAENRDGHWYFQADPVTNEPPRLYTFAPTGELSQYLEVTGRDSWLNLTKDVWNYMADPPAKPEELTYQELRALQTGVRGAGMAYSAGLFLTPQVLTFLVHRRFAVPLSGLVAILIAIPLAIRFGRNGGYVGLLLAMVLAFCFVVAQQWAQVLAIKNLLPPIIAAWAPDAFFGFLGLGMLLGEE